MKKTIQLKSISKKKSGNFYRKYLACITDILQFQCDLSKYNIVGVGHTHSKGFMPLSGLINKDEREVIVSSSRILWGSVEFERPSPTGVAVATWP